jgi:non-specific serine/threonine protein kinase
MSLEMFVTPHGRIGVAKILEEGNDADEALARRLTRAFDDSTAQGLLQLATAELETRLPPGLSFAREFSQRYLTDRCRLPVDPASKPEPLEAPAREELALFALRCPPLRGSEYLSADLLATWWTELDALVLAGIRESAGDSGDYLTRLNPAWRFVGRVTFHLAENKRDVDHPFAFLATYTHRLSAQARAQHQPLGKALQEYASARDRQTLVSLLSPVRRAAEQCSWVNELVESGEIYHPLTWTPAEAHRFLQDIPKLEAAGLIVRVPDWWHAKAPPRPVVNVKIGNQGGVRVGADSLLDFQVDVAFDGEPLTEAELQSLWSTTGGLVSLKGRWVEVDREKLAQALKHWRRVERAASDGGVSFFEGMRLLSGVSLPGDVAQSTATDIPEWTGITASDSLAAALRELQDPQQVDRPPPGLQADLRPYQQVGVHWLRFMVRLGLGGCLADDMGLGKTIQVIGLLLHLRHQDTSNRDRTKASAVVPSLLIVPASLIGNWKAELARFAPSLGVRIAHPSEGDDMAPIVNDKSEPSRAVDKRLATALKDCDLVISTYGMIARLDSLRRQHWRLVILDEAQAIKNASSRQTRAVKELKGTARLALTGTPVENRLGDLWSIFDFLNPGLLGGAKEFATLAKRLTAQGGPGYGPLRTLIRPYLLRRLKTDKSVIRDLPEKSELNVYCGLSKQQAALYEGAVRELARQLKNVEGIQRRGVVLSYLMRFKQICNHPSQLSGDGAYDAEHSGKFERLGQLCGELAERQEKALVFTQFRELTTPLAEFLAGVFGQPGLVLHGQTPVARRRTLVQDFQREDGPPFFVLSLKAGGIGLNLTEASHVVHFDRWWNPAVENQATDRAFRIGQKRNVLVHKFICRGTLEERIDAMIAQKKSLANELLSGGGETLLTELNDQELLRFVSLDLRKAVTI